MRHPGRRRATRRRVLQCRFLRPPGAHPGARRGAGRPSRTPSLSTDTFGWRVLQTLADDVEVLHEAASSADARARPSASGWTRAPATCRGDEGRPGVRPPHPAAGGVRVARTRATRVARRCAPSWSPASCRSPSTSPAASPTAVSRSDDLVQVATVGLINAVDRFSPERGSDFFSFAVPTISGEVRRHFRDLGWSMRVPRRLKDLHVSINGVVSELSQSLGRAPKPTEIAERLGVPVSEVLEGLEASEAYRSSSLDEMLSSEQGSATVGELVGEADAELDRVDFRQALRPVLAELAPRERTIVLLRFFGNMTQTQIAAGGRDLADARLPAAHADPGPAAQPAGPRDPRGLSPSGGSCAMSQPEHVLVVGAGLGGLRTVEQLRSRASRAGSASSATSSMPRTTGRRSPSRCSPANGTPSARRCARWRASRTWACASISACARWRLRTRGEVELADGASLHADAIVIATGLAARTLPGQPTAVHTLRTLDDALALRAALSARARSSCRRRLHRRRGGQLGPHPRPRRDRAGGAARALARALGDGAGRADRAADAEAASTCAPACRSPGSPTPQAPAWASSWRTARGSGRRRGGRDRRRAPAGLARRAAGSTSATVCPAGPPGGSKG